jgi:integrase
MAAGRTAYLLTWRLHGRQSSQSFDDLRTAQRWRDVLVAAGPAVGVPMMDAALTAPTGMPTVRDVIAGHIDTLPGVTTGTRNDYLRDAVNNLYPHFGDHLVSAVSRAMVARWVGDLADGRTAGGGVRSKLSGKTIRNQHALLVAALAGAVRDGWIEENPATGVRLPRSIRTKDPLFMASADVAVLLRHLDGHWHPLIRTMVLTGIRWGEATALRPLDVEPLPAGGRLHVRRAWKRINGSTVEIGPPKSDRSLRTVPYGPALALQLAPVAAARPADDLLFATPRGARIRSGHFHERVWGPAALAAMADEQHRLPRRPRIHDLRHTAASWWLEDRVPIHVVSELLGHESITTTVRVYGHLSNAARDGAAERMDERAGLLDQT